MDDASTFLAVTDTANPRAIAMAIVAVGIGIGIATKSWAIGAIVAALGVIQWFFVSRTRWLFDKIAGSATLVDESGWKRTVLGTWPLGDFAAVLSRQRVTEDSDSSSHRYDLALLDRSGTERAVASFPSPKPAKNLAAFLSLPLQEVGPLGGDARIGGIADALPGVLMSFWREKGLRGLTHKEEAVSFLRDYAQSHPNDPVALELLGTALAASGEVSGAVQSFQEAAQAYRARGESANADRAEQTARRLIS